MTKVKKTKEEKKLEKFITNITRPIKNKNIKISANGFSNNLFIYYKIYIKLFIQ